ncbi:MAG: cytochrome b/b6 domain-containing protein [Actinomycetota bacterium]|nr:cytochrome b/b6 domain-containing protein [Actinomycetota bacterium]
MELDFPGWLRLTHFLNIIFISFLVRSGIEILSSHPKLYFNDDCRHGSEWARFTRKEMPTDKLWTSKDEEEDYSSVVALPGHSNLGLGRHWHFASVIGWILTGLVYIVLLFTTGEWLRLIPTSWEVFAQAFRDMVTYLSLDLPEKLPGEPYNALQKLAYAGVVFVLGPLMIATGAAMSPAVAARFPWYIKPFGGRQAARSIHFLTLLAFLLFVVVHVFMVVVHGFGKEMALMIFGAERNTTLAVIITFAALVGLVLLHWAATRFSLQKPRTAQRLLGGIVNPTRKLLFRRVTSKQSYPQEAISPAPRVNGRPPNGASYKALAENGFKDWKLEVYGLVEHPRALTLEELRTFPTKQTQITKHNCIQGWSYVAKWTGVPLRQILELVKPVPEARYLVLRAMDYKPYSEPEPEGEGYFYGTIDLELASHPQTILAYEMNDEPLPLPHGAPLRLRVETQLGFKMVKYVRAIEFVRDYRSVGEGLGGWREDNQFYDTGAGI